MIFEFEHFKIAFKMMKLVKSKIHVRICIIYAKRYSGIVWNDSESYNHEHT